MHHFATNNIPLDGLTLIMSPVNALALSFRANLDGSPEFPGVGVGGGTHKGSIHHESTPRPTNVIGAAAGAASSMPMTAA